MKKPDCLEGETHIWVFPTGTGSTKIFGTRSAGSSFYSGSEVSINYKRTATCRICDQRYTFDGIESPYDSPPGVPKRGKKTQKQRKAEKKRKIRKARAKKQQKQHEENVNLGRIGVRASYAVATNRIKKLGYTDFSKPDNEACILRDETAQGLREEWGGERYLQNIKENKNG